VLLPALADMRAPLPLGGTSNHFPTRVLKAVGAWDPFNVTEDADLGVRLARFGHPTVMLDSRTFEKAPVYGDQWLPQRRRWLKGWMQTAAVCLAPGRPRACRLGPVDWLAVHGIVTAGVVSLLVYPLSAVVVTLAALLLEQGLRPTSALGTALFWLNGFNLFAFLFATYLSALRGLRAVGALRLAPWLFFLPAYWTLMSFAAWQALFQFLTEPSRWEETRHGVAPQRRTPLKAFRRRRERAGERAGG
jgi:cellulose synthase/poly-beta-1,6-N-acetylglucosamine synthase-like glycosyltransferase